MVDSRSVTQGWEEALCRAIAHRPGATAPRICFTPLSPQSWLPLCCIIKAFLLENRSSHTPKWWASGTVASFNLLSCKKKKAAAAAAAFIATRGRNYPLLSPDSHKEGTVISSLMLLRKINFNENFIDCPPIPVRSLRLQVFLPVTSESIPAHRRCCSGAGGSDHQLYRISYERMLEPEVTFLMHFFHHLFEQTRFREAG